MTAPRAPAPTAPAVPDPAPAAPAVPDPAPAAPAAPEPVAPDPVALRDLAIAACRRAGFHRVGIVPVEPSRRADVYAAWLAAGHHGEMAYLATPAHVAGHADPAVLLEGARTILVVALAYGAGDGAPRPPPGDGPRPDGEPAPVPLRGVIARYARGTDYHLIVRDRLRAVADELVAAAGPIGTRVCVDTAPLPERELAERAGLGFAAKNTMIIAPGLGSYVVLGELILTAALAPTGGAPERSRCGACRACLDACPTGAFVDAYVLDARRCISYLTIEHDGAIPVELRAAMGARIFGCDVCQEVCPWNAVAPERVLPALELTARDDQHAAPDLARLATIGANQLRGFVRRTALRRIDRARLQRNVAVALGNSADDRALAPLAALVAHADPIVRGHAAWGLGALAGAVPSAREAARALLAAAAARETDPAAAAEIAGALRPRA